jgi:WD40 repeat protein
VATCSADTTIKIWNISNPLNWTLINTLREIANDVPEIEYVNNDTFAIGQGGAIKIRSLSNGSTLASFNVGHTSIFCLKLLSNGIYLAAGLDNNFGIRIYDFKTGTIKVSLNASNCSGVYDLAQISSDLLASSSTDHNVRIWNLTTYSLKFTLSGHTLNVYGLKLVSSDILASGSSDSSIKFWNISNGELIRTLTGHRSFIQWSIDLINSQTLVSGSSDKTIKLWNITTGLCLRTFNTSLEIKTLVVLNSYTSKLDPKIFFHFKLLILNVTIHFRKSENL